jgi:hypothetical protein
MKKYYYPISMNSSPVFWFWTLKDIVIIITTVILSILVWITTKTYIPLCLSLLNAFLSIRTEEKSLNDLIILAVRYIFFRQKTYIYPKEEMKNEKEKHNGPISESQA